MKTIAELNEKWYWRFIKVIFFLIIFISIIWIFSWSYSMYHTYDPKDVKIVEERFEKFYNKYKKGYELNLELKNIYPNFSLENLIKITKKLEYKEKVPFILILILLSEYQDWNFENINFCDDFQIELDCIKEWDNKGIDYYNKIKNNWLKVSFDYVYEFKEIWYIKDINKIIEYYNSYKNWNKTNKELLKYYLDISWKWWYEKYFPYEYFSEYDYRWLNEWIKIIFSFIWFIFLFFLFLFLIRWITYYIILWNFNPKN